MCLDRRGLTEVPRLVGERSVRLLSLQHNLLSRVEGMQQPGMRKLVFLDLYNNRVERLLGLESLESLRVLLVGKNRVRRVEGLSPLRKLEVLDLHGNEISEVSGLCTLKELKVLNLAGNRIRAVEAGALEGLTALQELNLKRNRVRRVSDLSGPLRLEKLFLSNNEILSAEDIAGVCKARSLREVSLDSNPVAAGQECVQLLVSSLPRLQVLSRMQVTEQVRRHALQWRKARETKGLLRQQTRALPLMTSSLKDLRLLEEDSKTIQSDSVLSVASSMTLSSRESLRGRASLAGKGSLSEEGEGLRLPPILAALAGEKRGEGGGGGGSGGSEGSGGSGGSGGSDSGSETGEDLGGEELGGEELGGEELGGEELGGEEVRGEGKGEGRREVRRSRSAGECRRGQGRGERGGTGRGRSRGAGGGKEREQGGDYLIEICGRCLNVYGQGALRFIDRPWNPAKAGEVTTVRFSYVSFGGISNVLGKLKQRFPRAERFVFRETNIAWLGQLNALADVQGLSSLEIEEEGNPISGKKWRKYAIYRLAHWGLKSINGEEVTEEEVGEVSREFEGLSELVLRALPETLLQPLLTRLRIEGGRSNPQQTARQWLWGAEPALRSVVVKEALQWRRGTQDDLYWRHRGRTHLGCMIDLTCAAVDKLQALETRWPSILNQLIRDTLVDYSHIDSYRKKCLQDLH